MAFFFEDFFKQDPNKSFIINYAPLFANLSPSEKKLILEKSKVVEYARGDLIYKQSDPADAFYCVISGRVRVFTIANEKKETLEYLHYGSYFGMISLLTGSPHSVNAEAANDSKVLKINKEDFQVIVDKIPKLAVDLSKTLSHRLNKSEDRWKKVFESNILSVFSAPGGSGHAAYATNLALGLKKETGKKIILINICNSADNKCEASHLLESPFLTDSAIKDAVSYESGSGVGILNIAYDRVNNPDCAGNFNSLLASLTSDFHFIIVYLPVLTSGAVFQILGQSDWIHVITDSDITSLKETKTLISGLLEKVNYPSDQIKIIVSADKEGKYVASEEALKILEHRVYATLPACSKTAAEADSLAPEDPGREYTAAIRKIAREVGDVLVGLALSGGAAFGLSHIGVIRAFEKEHIPVDVVSGSSMGAVVGALWAIGLDSDGLEKFAMEFSGHKKKVFNLLADFGFSKLSFFKGKRVKDLFERYLGTKTFQDTRFPLKIVACNLSKRQKVVYESGSLLEAVMASLAIPGVFSPANVHGDLILDGGIIEPVPIGTLLQMGIKKVIAVNVLPSPEDISQGYALELKRKEEEKKKVLQQGFFARMKYRIDQRIAKMFFPNIFDIIVNSIQILEYMIAERDCTMVDVVLRPIAPGAEWFEFYKGEELIKMGEEEANKSMAAIKILINE